MPKETNKTAPKYIKPSQRIGEIVKQASDTGTPMQPFEVSLTVELAILDKIDEMTMILRSFIPRPAAVEKVK